MGPKTALKLIREHGNLEGVIEQLHLQADIKAEKAANSSPKKAKSVSKKGKGKAKVEDSDDEDAVKDEDEEEEKEEEDQKPVVAPPKKRGGMQIPENWPYKEAKELFKNPDVQKGDDLEVS